MKNKIVLITGASGGIGSVMSQYFANEGATVIAHYNSNKETAEKLIRKLSGNSHSSIKGDLTNTQDVENLISYTMSEHGKIDVLILIMRVYFGSIQ